jgi:hypothetical protein
MKNTKTMLFLLIATFLMCVGLASAGGTDCLTAGPYTYGDAYSAAELCIQWNFDSATSFNEGEWLEAFCDGDNLYVSDSEPYCHERGCSGTRIAGTYHRTVLSADTTRLYYACWDRDDTSTSWAWSYVVNGFERMQVNRPQTPIPGPDFTPPTFPDTPPTIPDPDLTPPTSPDLPPEGSETPSGWIDRLIQWIRDFLRSLGLGSLTGHPERSDGGGGFR